MPGGSFDPRSLFSGEAFEELLNTWGRFLARYLRAVPHGPVMKWDEPEALAERLGEADFEEGVAPGEVIKWFEKEVLPFCQHHFHRLVAGHMIGTPLPMAVAADVAANLLNQGMGIWEVAPGPVALTQQLVRYFLDKSGFGPGADGILTTGGTEANLTALLAARSRLYGPEARERGIPQGERPVVLASELSHYSIARSAGVIGIGRRNVLRVPADELFRMNVKELERMADGLQREGRRILCVCAVSGSTSVGSFDPLEEIACACRKRGLFLHIDGAHGASAMLSDRHRHLLAGVSEADSLTWDPHKMLFVPGVLGMLLVKDGTMLSEVFDERPSYLFSRKAEDQPRWNFLRKNLRCTQRFDALKLWAALKFYGRKTFARLIDTTVARAEALWKRLCEEKCFEPLVKPSFNIVCFRYVPQSGGGLSEEKLDFLQEEIRTGLLREGSAWITTTRVRERVYLRITVMNPMTEEKDIEELLGLIRSRGRALRG